ncbi:germinal-center associated nuclear protein-like [Uloborus diversus]|uniref:germinal-center associated nuclear protein-like n=1 Tax=Uloborus diversus TaxID=327109 RepID=UPI0024091AB3|nr:germinal-center associated nuclear protein-like [Uloborus diversus]
MCDKDLIIGTCSNMCPEKEMKWREKNKLLHVLEIKKGGKFPEADPDKAIKQFSRSAAGKVQPSPSDLRTPSTLLNTTNYLINEILPLTSVPFITIYDFVNDRIQAIRQDIVIQRIKDFHAVTIMKKCIRFYILSAYLLCEEPITAYDPHLNEKQLVICLDNLLALNGQPESNEISEFIAIHFALNIHNSETFYRSTIMNSYKTEWANKSIKACFAYLECNVAKFFKIVKTMPIILLLCFFQLFQKIRKHALKQFNTAFSSSMSKFPLDVLCDLLCLETKQTALNLCKIYSIRADTDFLYFDKKVFDSTESTACSRKEEIIERLLKDVKISDLINEFM